MDTNSGKGKTAAKQEEAPAEVAAPPVLNMDDDNRPANNYVRYVGAATRRVLTAEDWERVGIEGKPATWHMGNGLMLPVSQFSQEQIDYLVNVDGRFQVV